MTLINLLLLIFVLVIFYGIFIKDNHISFGEHASTPNKTVNVGQTDREAFNEHARSAAAWLPVYKPDYIDYDGNLVDLETGQKNK